MLRYIIISIFLPLAAIAQDKLGEFVMTKPDGEIAERLFTTVGTVLGAAREGTNRDGSAKTEAQRKASLTLSNFLATHYLLSPDRLTHWDALVEKVGKELLSSSGFQKNVSAVVAAHLSETFRATRSASAGKEETQDLYKNVALTDAFCAEIINRLSAGVTMQRARLVERVKQVNMERGPSYVGNMLSLLETLDAADMLIRFEEEQKNKK